MWLEEQLEGTEGLPEGLEGQLKTSNAGLYKVSEQASGARRHQPHFVGREGKGKRRKK